MTARPPFPGDRTFAGWWKQFSPLHPRGLWAGHFLIQQVELLTRVESCQEVDPLSMRLLREIAQAQPCTDDFLESRLHLGRALTLLLHDLETAALIARDPPTWRLTPRGGESIEKACYPSLRHGRRSFRFLDLRPAAPPCRLPDVDLPPTEPWSEPINPAQGLADADLRPLLTDVDVLPYPDDGGPTAWQRIPIIRTERWTAAVVAVEAPDGEKLQVLKLKPESWTVAALDPCFTLPAGSIPSVPLEAWRSAWREWCLNRQVTEAEIASCVLERQQHRLQVQASPGVVDRLKTARSDVFRGDSWIVAGEGTWREGAVIVLKS